MPIAGDCGSGRNGVASNRSSALMGLFLVGEHLAARNTPERGSRIPLVAKEADGVLVDVE